MKDKRYLSYRSGSRKARFWMLVVLVIGPPPILCQIGMPMYGIWSRVRMVRSKSLRGTIFSVDVDKREYWITAKHLVTGTMRPPFASLTNKSVSLELRDPNSRAEKWVPITFAIVDTEQDVDVVVLASPTPLLAPGVPSPSLDSAELSWGGDCEFLGFPYEGGWLTVFGNGTDHVMPYVKRCTVSALSGPGAKFWFLDGTFNDGFSGGPLVCGTGDQETICGVISDYQPDSAGIGASHGETSNGVQQGAVKAPGETANVNAGFIIAYDIKYAVEAIHKSPIGPSIAGR